MVWCVDLDVGALEILETGSAKSSERAGRAAHRYSVWRIGANIGLASQRQCLIYELNQLSTTVGDEVVKDKNHKGILTVSSQKLRTASADAKPGTIIDQL